TPGRRVAWQIRHLPHLVDAGDYAALVAGYLPRTAVPAGRRMTALALARLAGATSWRTAVEAMGMAARWARLDSYLSRRIFDAAGHGCSCATATRTGLNESSRRPRPPRSRLSGARRCGASRTTRAPGTLRASSGRPPPASWSPTRASWSPSG